MRLALFISKRTRRSREFGWSVVAFQSPDQLELITLSGIVVDPRPFRDWRARPECRRRTVSVSRVRENRTHGSMRRGLETEHLAMVTAVKRPAGETRGKVAAGPSAGQLPPRQPPT